MELRLTRDVAPEECSWLDDTLVKGTIWYEYFGHTYGCVGPGVACTKIEHELPFLEIPRDALTPSP